MNINLVGRYILLTEFLSMKMSISVPMKVTVTDGMKTYFLCIPLTQKGEDVIVDTFRQRTLLLSEEEITALLLPEHLTLDSLLVLEI